jgi:AdoMet-dependent heme synthase
MEKERLPVLPHTLRMVAWEVTRRCNLACAHCRASSQYAPYPGELDTDLCRNLLSQISAVGKPVIILTGGEPLLRADIFDIATYGNSLGLRMVLATNGTLVTRDIAVRMKKSGISRVSVSIDGKDAKSHDAFRKVAGAFEGALAGINAMKEVGLEFQINTTITRLNVHEMADIMDMAVAIGAAAHHIFLLVPTGRGRELSDQAISPEEYERTLNRFYEKSLACGIQLKATCAPHYYRILKQKGRVPASLGEGVQNQLHAVTRGCLGGSSFCFISHTGQVQPCGYLELDCGQIKEQNFSDIWNHAAVFEKLRDLNHYKGKCGHCEFIRVCGGCRARAYEMTGDYLAEEPFCIYQPNSRRGSVS